MRTFRSAPTLDRVSAGQALTVLSLATGAAAIVTGGNGAFLVASAASMTSALQLRPADRG